jgi:hypothetical protein
MFRHAREPHAKEHRRDPLIGASKVPGLKVSSDGVGIRIDLAAALLLMVA